MPIRLAWLPGCLLISSIICASAQVKQHSIKLQDLPDAAELYRLADSGEVYKVAADSKQARLTVLPPDAMQHDPRLMGVCDFDGDGTDEVFIAWMDLEIPRVDPTDKREVIVIFGDPTTISIVRIYRVKSATGAEFVSELRIEGRHLEMRFAKASSLRDTNRVFLSVMGGAKWSVFYALSFDGKSTFLITEHAGNSPREPGGASWGELDDLDGDGVREWVMWSLEGGDHKCPHGLYIPSFGPEIYRPSCCAVKRIWPPEDWAIADEAAPVAITPSSDASLNILWNKKYLVMAQLCDIDDDGRDEIVAVTDFTAEPSSGRTLSIFRLRAGTDSFAETASIQFATDSMPLFITGIRRLKDRKQIMLRFADPARYCTEGADYRRGVITGGGIDYQDGKLSRSWMNDNLDQQVDFEVKDIDGDGEDEGIFTPRVTGQFAEPPALSSPLLLKGVKTFVPLAARR